MHKPVFHYLPPLKERFLPLTGWHWEYFQSRNNLKIRYGWATAEKPEGIIIILPGRAEFAEKYFETARDLLAQNLSVWVIDWAGQGASQRFLDSQHGHAKNFNEFVDDLHQLITEYIKPQGTLIMLAHSTGANIGLHYLAKHPDIFARAAFTAPLCGIRELARLPACISLPLLWVLKTFRGEAYAFGQRDWSAEERTHSPIFSGDKIRSTVHDAWMSKNPELQIGGVTFGWLYHAVKACHNLTRKSFLKKIRTPCLVAVAGNDRVVDNTAGLKMAENLPDAEILMLEDSAHEILMERNSIRDRFMKAFFDFIPLSGQSRERR